MWNLKTKSSEYNKTDTHIEDKLVVITSRERWEGRGNIGMGNQEVQTIIYETNKLQGWIVQHREYNQYFIHINGI